MVNNPEYRLLSFHNDWAELCVVVAGKPLPINHVFLDERNWFCVGHLADPCGPPIATGEEGQGLYQLYLSYEVEGLRYDA